MKLYYFRDGEGNFGDDINGILWPALMPEVWDESDHIFLGIGTLIAPGLPPAKRWTVFGSGAGYGPLPAGLGGPDWNIVCVRGPYTARLLGMDTSRGVTDGAILLSALPEYQPLPESSRSGIVFMPHHRAATAGEWREACEMVGITYIDPREDCVETLRKLRASKLVIADAMHAAIVADTLRVPWVPVITSREINTFKWMDWCLSMEVPYEPLTLPFSGLVEQTRDNLLPLWAAVFCVPSRSEKEVFQNFSYHSKIRTLKAWPLIRNVGAGTYKKIAKPLAKKWVSLFPKGEQDRRERAAQALIAASTSRSYLSSDSTFESRKTQMLELLQTVRAAGPNP